MDRQLFAEDIQEFLMRYQGERYRGIALSAKTQREIEIIYEVLSDLLTDWQKWDKPGAHTLNVPCHRKDFLDYAVKGIGLNHRNLLLLSPENWMFSWPDVDKETFWAGCAEMFGAHTLITVSLESHATLSLLQLAFKPVSLPHSSVQLWLSKHQTWA